ncbi:bacterial Ig-like domain-containing protein [Listeria marthii]|uniref:bacterial Ig-like domain-containing protein n=1 Tax=Listeria marthii TaxID=529731 RepID=UPI00188887EC|nr:bacterial Ig-like domain-containing protein [Listeria marthii]MBF2477466.1 bacterial Ig-like domain-containing protein [Listeria marthii]MBF2494099.1 bacterial Ig-like domain-containing protein [Listeria marthii]
MKKAITLLSTLVISFSIFSVNPLSGLAFEKGVATTETKQQVNATNAATDIVTAQDLGDQTWLINEVNKQLAPKTVGVDLTFEDLAKITRITITGRGLTGEVPPEIKNLVSLESLILYSNNLTGTIPAELGELTKLKALRLDYNKLTGTIPDGLGNIPSIELQRNRLVGQIPLSLYENRTGTNEVNVSGNQVTINSRAPEPSIYSYSTFIYPATTPEYGGHLKATTTYISNLENDAFLTPFLPGSSTFIDLQAVFMFETELYEGHEVTITDDASGKLLYEGELTSDISISLKSLSSGYHNIRVVLDNAPNNPQNQVTFGISIVSTVAGDLTVNYVDETGKTIHEPQTVSGFVGDDYDVTTDEYQLAIDGYELDNSKLPTDAIGTFDHAPLSVTYVYKAVPATIKAHDSTIYVGDNWTAADNFDSVSDNFGATVSFDDVTVEGTVDTTIAGVYPVTYRFAGESITIQVTVKNKDIPANSVTPSDPSIPSEQSASTTPKTPGKQTAKSPTLKITPTQSETYTVTGKLKLPTTGDNFLDSIIYSLFGFIAICVAFCLFFLSKKQKHS